MSSPHLEIARYGPRRLRKIARFIRNGGPGYELLFGEERSWALEFGFNTPKPILVDRISNCGAFQHVAQRFLFSWERLLAGLAIERKLMQGVCNLFGMEQESNRLSNQGLRQEEGMIILQRLVNKLSNVYTFPGDPMHPISRKRMNDIRLNALFRKNIFGKEPLSVAQGVTSFKDAVVDPLLRVIFWSCYVPGTGLFNVSISNLDQLTESEDCCSICMDDLSITFPGIKLQPCNHVFHPRCIQSLILSMGDQPISCPLCRTLIMDLG